jgi:HAD superfamily hydrolase (TIGR01549 family)
MTPRAVTFDVDGTLTDARALRWPMFFRNFRRLSALRVGMRVREELRRRKFSSGGALRDAEAREVAERLQLTPEAARALLDDIFDRSLVAALNARRPSKVVRPSIEQLVGAGWAIGVVSDRRVDDKLAALGLADLPWRARISADDVGRLKPDPELFRSAARALGVEPGALTHIGDRDDTDGQGARAAGAAFVLVRGPDEIPSVVDKLLAPG